MMGPAHRINPDVARACGLLEPLIHVVQSVECGGIAAPPVEIHTVLPPLVEENLGPYVMSACRIQRAVQY